MSGRASDLSIKYSVLGRPPLLEIASRFSGRGVTFRAPPSFGTYRKALRHALPLEAAPYTSLSQGRLPAKKPPFYIQDIRIFIQDEQLSSPIGVVLGKE
jgi:hypothetical protein